MDEDPKFINHEILNYSFSLSDLNGEGWELAGGYGLVGGSVSGNSQKNWNGDIVPATYFVVALGPSLGPPVPTVSISHTYTSVHPIKRSHAPMSLKYSFPLGPKY